MKFLKIAGLPFFILMSATPFLPAAPLPWSVDSYGAWEAGFQARTKDALPRLAAQGFGRRSLATSRCPDTGQVVRTWALEGEEIISPFTGRRYRQGNTGYFGPKERDSEGRIIAFGGDPLKFELPPATAALLLDEGNQEAKWFLSIPGNINQQYHFAAANWGRFYPLHAETMGQLWRDEFHRAVGLYSEARRPSDGDREHAPLARPFTLVGTPEEHLGGGGTENHRIMWRTTTLLYSQLFPEDALISGHTTTEAGQIAGTVLQRFAQGLLTHGSGEYNSGIYFPHSMYGFFNLHDFSPDPRSRAMAKAVLEYYVASYGLKTVLGRVAGPQRRGAPAAGPMNEMDRVLWFWHGLGDPPDSSMMVPPLHQATSSFRPNQVLMRLLQRDMPLPFQAEIAHPDYFMQHRNRHQETLFVSHHFTLGSVRLDAVNNSSQQVTWSLVATDGAQTLSFSGGQPRWRQRGGHSPYDQWLQHRSTLIHAMAPTIVPEGRSGSPALESVAQLEGPRGYDRMTAFTGPLLPVTDRPDLTMESLRDFLTEAHRHAMTFVYAPRESITVEEVDGSFFMDAGDVRIALLSLKSGAFLLSPDTSKWSPMDNRDPLRIFETDQIFVFPGESNGFVLMVVERELHDNLPEFIQKVRTHTRLDLSEWETRRILHFTNLEGDVMIMQYDPSGLRADGSINGQAINWDGWAGGGVILSPVLRISDGRKIVSNGTEGYLLDYTGDSPVYREWNGPADAP